MLLSAAKAARAAEKEAQALRAARISYQQALLDQQEERSAMLKSINDALKVGRCTALCILQCIPSACTSCTVRFNHSYVSRARGSVC